jgi:hypothetical protein
MTANADYGAVPNWRCPPCDDGIDSLPCECFEIMALLELPPMTDEEWEPFAEALGFDVPSNDGGEA